MSRQLGGQEDAGVGPGQREDGEVGTVRPRLGATRFAAMMKEPEFQPIIGFAQPWSPGTNGPVTGQAMMAVINGPEDMEKFKGKLKGKIVLTAATHASPLNEEPLSHRLTDAELDAAADGARSGAGESGGAAAGLPPSRRRAAAPGAARARSGGGGGRGGANPRAFRNQLNKFLKEEGVLVVLTPGNGPDGGTIMGQAAGSQNRAKRCRRPRW